MIVFLISICKDKLHEKEFVRPIEDILEKNGLPYFLKDPDLDERDLISKPKIIICGTSLKDFGYLKNIDKFSWLKDYSGPVLGICAGMQIIGKIYGGEEKKKTEIGFFKEKFNQDFLCLSGEQEVYHLHNSSIDFSKLKDFRIYSKSNDVIQAVKHKEKPLYGVLFHPEVRNKNLILEFVKNG